MLEVKDNIYVGRNADGHVRIVKLKQDPSLMPSANEKFGSNAIFDITFNEIEWAQIMAYVCEKGDSEETFRHAYEFHQGIPEDTMPEKEDV